MIRSRKYKGPTYDKSLAIKPPKKSVLYKIVNHFMLLPLNQHKWISRIKSVATITDEIVCYQWFAQDLKAKPSLYRSKTVEIECHPGLHSNLEETNLLMQDEIKKIIGKYTLINYYQL